MLYVVDIQYFSEENIPLPIEKINKSSQNAKMRIFTCPMSRALFMQW